LWAELLGERFTIGFGIPYTCPKLLNVQGDICQIVEMWGRIDEKGKSESLKIDSDCTEAMSPGKSFHT
jgi:hypothetical protein